jgi:Na+/H+ antiporter NhaD/arsenite permease-like protein
MRHSFSVFCASGRIGKYQIKSSRLGGELPIILYIILVLGGGFAMAEGSKASGLSDWMGEQLVGLKVLPTWLVVLIICLMTTFATEVSSNTAVANILLPVLAEMVSCYSKCILLGTDFDFSCSHVPFTCIPCI